MVRECKTHGRVKFFKRKECKNSYRCSKCASEAVAKRRRTLKIKALDYLGNKCKSCGYSKCVEALEFHHRDSKEKDFGIARKGITRAWSKVKKELDKCDLLCANCHREFHSKSPG